MLLKTTHGIPVEDRIRPGFPSPVQRQVSARRVCGALLNEASAVVLDGLAQGGRRARLRLATFIYPDLALQTASAGVWDSITDEDDD